MLPNNINSFWLKVRKTRGCWLWLKAKDEDGYGAFHWKNKQVKAHRFVAMYIMKLSISGKCVCHTCDNPSCVNPKHLFVSTSQGNTADRNAKGRQVKGESCHTSKLKERDVISIRRDFKIGMHRSEIARRFHVSKSTIDFIVTRRTWKHLKG